MKVEFGQQRNWKEVDGEHQKISLRIHLPAAAAKSFPNTHIKQIERKLVTAKLNFLTE